MILKVYPLKRVVYVVVYYVVMIGHTGRSGENTICCGVWTEEERDTCFTFIEVYPLHREDTSAACGASDAVERSETINTTQYIQ